MKRCYLSNAKNHVGIVGTILGNVRTAYLKAANSVYIRKNTKNCD